MAKNAVKQDKVKWMENKAAGVSKQLGEGVVHGVWAWVRRLAGEKRKGPRTIAVLKNSEG